MKRVETGSEYMKICLKIDRSGKKQRNNVRKVRSKNYSACWKCCDISPANRKLSNQHKHHIAILSIKFAGNALS